MTDPLQASVLQKEVATLLCKRASRLVDPTSHGEGYNLRYFLVPKKDGRFRHILDLRLLNGFLKERRFQMLTHRHILQSVRPGDWFTTMDVRDAYFHIPIRPEHNPKESYAMHKSKAYEGSRVEAVYTQEEPFDQEWCGSLKKVTELTFVKDEEVPQLECVPIKEEFLEQECVPIAEEVPTENNVCTLEENNQLGSNLYDDCPPEYELGFRAAKGNYTGGTLFPCADCGKSFSRFSQLKIHQRVHTGDKPYHCFECGRSFTQLQNLKRHQRSHTGEKPYHCIECGSSFTVLQNLKRHQRSHTGEKPYHCATCEKSFAHLISLKTHQQTHKKYILSM